MGGAAEKAIDNKTKGKMKRGQKKEATNETPIPVGMVSKET
jgi:hypothetical protein